jgi:hypothetical protein
MRGLETRVRGLEKATGQGERHTIFFVEVGPEGDERRVWPPVFLGDWSAAEKEAELARLLAEREG